MPEKHNYPPDLNGIERKVIQLRFGKAKRIRDISQELDMPIERVLIIEKQAIKKIMREAGFKVEERR